MSGWASVGGLTTGVNHRWLPEVREGLVARRWWRRRRCPSPTRTSVMPFDRGRPTGSSRSGRSRWWWASRPPSRERWVPTVPGCPGGRRRGGRCGRPPPPPAGRRGRPRPGTRGRSAGRCRPRGPWTRSRPIPTGALRRGDGPSLPGRVVPTAPAGPVADGEGPQGNGHRQDDRPRGPPRPAGPAQRRRRGAPYGHPARPRKYVAIDLSRIGVRRPPAPPPPPGSERARRPTGDVRGPDSSSGSPGQCPRQESNPQPDG